MAAKQLASLMWLWCAVCNLLNELLALAAGLHWTAAMQRHPQLAVQSHFLRKWTGCTLGEKKLL
jgi:hypothetical protein